jgi:sulfonate transport system substrate-binding protein
MKRNAFLLALLLLGFHAAKATDNSTPTPKEEGGKTLRIGYQKYGTLIIVKALGHLDSSFSKKGWKVSWFQFPAGPQLLEGLNAGAIDFGTVGEAPPIFGQAAGAPLIYVANEPPSPKAEAILVPKDSPIQTVADLKGKRVALNKGSNVHYLLVQALNHAGLKYTDIQTVFLPPADARAAFESGKVDAWVIWDPFEGVAQKATGARVLTDGEGLVANHQFYFASRSFAAAHPHETRAVIQAIQEADKETREKPQEVAAILSPEVQIDTATLAFILKRSNFGAVITRAPVIAEQQKIADAFYSLGLIPKQIAVRDDQWVDAPETKN